MSKTMDYFDFPQPVTDLFQASWFLPYIGFALGLSAALYSKKTRDGVEMLAKWVEKDFMLGGKAVPLHLLRAINKRSAKVTYWLIKHLLLLTLAWHTAVVITAKSESSGVLGNVVKPLINGAFVFYCLNTALVSAHDVLLHDDKSLWSDDAKFRHVLMPFDLEDKKVFAAPSSDTHYLTQMKVIQDSLADIAPRVSGFTIATLLAWQLCKDTPVLYIFMTPLVWYAHYHLLKVLDLLFDALMLHNVRNRFEHFFGDNLEIVYSGAAHEFFGKQYQYFVNYFSPLERLCYQQFYKVAKNEHAMSVAESKAAYYLGRGGIVLAGLILINAIPCDLKTIAAYSLYYGIHAAAAYSNEGRDDWWDQSWKRGLALSGEIILSGYLFYRPLLQRLS